jgi:hypothetical protein
MQLIGQVIVRGLVTSSSDGYPISGVKITARGSFYSMSRTNKKGEYEIEIPLNASGLKFSKAGFLSETAGLGGRTIDIELKYDPAYKVIVKDSVTRLISRIDFQSESNHPSFFNKLAGSKLFFSTASRSVNDSIFAEIGYGLTQSIGSGSVYRQVFTGSSLNPAFRNNLNEILAGKVSGLKPNGWSEISLDQTGSLSFRGQGGFTAGRAPVYMVDGTMVNDISAINYNEIESVTVMPGSASAALLGSRAVGGAVLITTKSTSGHAGKERIELNSSLKFSNVYMLPEYQNEYAGGIVGDMYQYSYRNGIDPVEWAPLDGKYYHDYSNDENWGPKMIGQEYIPWYAWYTGTKYTAKTALLNPQPDNVRDFYNTGLETSNTVSLVKDIDNMSIRVSGGNRNYSGLIPNSMKNSTFFGLKASFDLVKWLRLKTGINFFSSRQNGEFDEAYGNMTSGTFNSWFHRDVEMSKLREFASYRTDYGPFSSWLHNNPTSWDPSYPMTFYGGYGTINPFTYFNITDLPVHNDKLYGFLSADISLFKGVKLHFTYRRNESTGWYEIKSPIYIYTNTQPVYQGFGNGYFETGTSYQTNDNYEGSLNFERKISGFTISANAGFDIYSYLYRYNSANTNNGLILDHFYTISNSRDLPTINVGRYRQRTNSFFIRGNAGYHDFLFAEAVLRREYHSTLPMEHNFIDLYSVGGTLVFTKVLRLPYMSFGKLRLSSCKIPSSIGIYSYPGISYGINVYQWNSNQSQTVGNAMVSSDISGSTERQTEAGADIGFLKGRISMSFTRWWGRETRIPVSQYISSFSGFTSFLKNSGVIEKSGTDFIFSGIPFNGERFTWSSSLLFSMLTKEKVVQTSDGNDILYSEGPNWGPGMYMQVNQPWGILIGSGMKTNSRGLPYLTSSGTYVSVSDKHFGSVIPKFTGGFQNTFHFLKNFSATLNLDFQKGGKFFSVSDMWGTYSGLTARTAGLNDKGNPVRDHVADGGGVHVSGVDQFSGLPVDYYVEAEYYFESLYYQRIFDFFIYDASYIKLRELSIEYRIPVEKLGFGKVISDAAVTFFAQNPLMIWSKQKNFDPSELTGIYGENAMFPSVRSFGMNLRLVF